MAMIERNIILRDRIAMGEFLPQGLFGAGDQCRNNPKWPFFVGDPVCLVRFEGKLMLDVCAVPLCAKSNLISACVLIRSDR